MNLKPYKLVKAAKSRPQPDLVALILAVFLTFSLVAISGCGKKGPLYLPKNSSQNLHLK